MFVIASGGRCGTLALCHGLDRFSDHHVEHEPDPPLREAWCRHTGRGGYEESLRRRLEVLAGRGDDRYGLSWRAPNLLDDVSAVAPGARFLVIVREPSSYVVSAHAKRVLSKGNEWDEWRLMPLGADLAGRSLAERIAHHWTVVNDYLLDFAERHAGSARVVLLDDLDPTLEDVCRHLGVELLDRDGLRAFLATRPNRAPGGGEPPPGYEAVDFDAVTGATWARACEAAA